MPDQYEINVHGVEDPIAQENWLKTRERMEEDIFQKFIGRHYEIEFSQAETNFKFPHGLRAMPLDVIQTSLTGAGTLTWNYTLFDNTYLDITTSGACVVRAYIGTYKEST